MATAESHETCSGETGRVPVPQLKDDEWPSDNEPTTTEREVPTSDADAAAVADFLRRADAAGARRPRRKQVDQAREEDKRKDQ